MMDPFGLFPLSGFENPLLYGVFFFFYVILNTILFPFPVELGLFHPSFHPIVLIGILALGRGVSAWIIFEIGGIVRKKVGTWSFDIPLMQNIITILERFIQRYGYYALFILMSIPLMLDSVVLYLFSLLNKRGKRQASLNRGWFIGVSIGASILRGTLILLIANVIGIILIY